jgi:serine/threonine-protein kinase
VRNRTVSRYGALPEGAILAGYRIKERAGQGGMATVYRTHDLRLDRWVALKVLSADAAADSDFRHRFIRESRAAAAVDHPNIIPIHEAGEADGVLYIAMRFVKGGDLSAQLKRHRVLPLDRVCDIVAQVAAALDAAHSHGLVHRDVKPANILLDAGTGRDTVHVYLTDFGVTNRLPLAHEPGSAAPVTEFAGTPPYVAPEQVEGRQVDGRADLYALACTAYQMLCGAPPFSHRDSRAVLWAQLYEPPPMLTAQRPDLPDLSGVFAKALAKSRRERYTSCLDFAAALHEAAGLGDRLQLTAEIAGPTGRAAESQANRPATRTDLTPPPTGLRRPGGRPPARGAPAPPGRGDRGGPARKGGRVRRTLPLVIVALMATAVAAGVAAVGVKQHGKRQPAQHHGTTTPTAAGYAGGNAGPGCPAVTGASAAAAAGAGGDGWLDVGGGPAVCRDRALATRKSGQVDMVQDTFDWTFQIGRSAICTAAIFIANVNPSSGTAHYQVFGTTPPLKPIAAFNIAQGQSKGTWVQAGPWRTTTGVLRLQLTDLAAFPGDVNHVTASAAHATCH